MDCENVNNILYEFVVGMCVSRSEDDSHGVRSGLDR